MHKNYEQFDDQGPLSQLVNLEMHMDTSISERK